MTGCTSQTPGTAIEVSGGDPATTTTRTTSAAPTTSQSNSIKPCSLLSASDRTALGITADGKPDGVKGASVCRWRVEKPRAADSYTVSVTFYAEHGVDDLVSSQEKTPVQLGKHKGVKALGDMDAGCVIALEISATSRVDVRAIGGDSAALCEPAMVAAEKVEARLP
ncbi:DUF3558 family protein [Actinokineospora cianjurensis]|uniref:DUF3558 family protein n=1 Tax=Actinokineospora cianjurensis TaxID=585224 RepID=UPI00147716DE|nr:DUF3558 family protein [Actinokineospora cianjurensis]